MPINNEGQNIEGKPEAQAPVHSPLQSAGDENVPPCSTKQTASQNEPIALRLEEEIRGGERWLIGLGILTLLMNSLIALIYWGQLQEMRKATNATQDAVDVASRTLTETQASNARQAAANEQARQDAMVASNASAATASAAIKATIDNFHQDHRAWLGVSDATFVIIDGRPLTEQVIITNVGRSPAINVVWRIARLFKPKETAVGAQSLVYGDTITRSPFGTAFPSQRFTMHNDNAEPSPEALIASLKSGDIVLYVFGEVGYQDVFSRNHWTHFCSIMDRDFIKAHPCPFYNDTDSASERENQR